MTCYLRAISLYVPEQARVKSETGLLAAAAPPRPPLLSTQDPAASLRQECELVHKLLLRLFQNLCISEQALLLFQKAIWIFKDLKMLQTLIFSCSP